MLSGRLVEAVGQLVGQGVSVVGVGAPASVIVPHTAAAGCINVDADNEGVVGFVTVADGHTVDAPAAFLQGDVLLFGHDKGGIVATALEMLDEDAREFRPVCRAG